MSKDIKLLLLAGVGVAFLAWGVAYYQQFGALVGTTTSGYGNVIRALEPMNMPQADQAPNASLGSAPYGSYT